MFLRSFSERFLVWPWTYSLASYIIDIVQGNLIVPLKHRAVSCRKPPVVDLPMLICSLCSSLRIQDRGGDWDTPDSFVPLSSPVSVVGMEVSRYPGLSLVKEGPPEPVPSPIILILPSSAAKDTESTQPNCLPLQYISLLSSYFDFEKPLTLNPSFLAPFLPSSLPSFRELSPSFFVSPPLHLRFGI